MGERMTPDQAEELAESLIVGGEDLPDNDDGFDDDDDEGDNEGGI